MKRLLCALLAAWLLAVPALADIIWEPQNSFYQRHQSQCEPEDRQYLTNGPEDAVSLLESPGGKLLAKVKNGARLYINHIYTGKEGAWGLVNYDADWAPEDYLETAEGASGGEAWVPMDEMLLRYDQQSFREDHAGEFVVEERTISLSGLRYCSYEFPGGELEFQQQNPESEAEVTVRELYTDEAGREWGYASYFYGSRDIWFCLSDLEDPDLPVEEHAAVPYTAPEKTDAEAREETAGAWLPVAVVLVCGVTAALLLRMKKKKQA